jgi:hypothetical protein
LLLFMVPISPVPAFILLYIYISTFRSMCAVPNMAVFCSSLTSCFPGMLLTSYYYYYYYYYYYKCVKRQCCSYRPNSRTQNCVAIRNLFDLALFLRRSRESSL